jgi:hypothetical protein
MIVTTFMIKLFNAWYIPYEVKAKTICVKKTQWIVQRRCCWKGEATENYRVLYNRTWVEQISKTHLHLIIKKPNWLGTHGFNTWSTRSKARVLCKYIYNLSHKSCDYFLIFSWTIITVFLCLFIISWVFMFSWIYTIKCVYCLVYFHFSWFHTFFWATSAGNWGAWGRKRREMWRGR